MEWKIRVLGGRTKKKFGVMKVKSVCSMYEVARLDRVRTEESNRIFGVRKNLTDEVDRSCVRNT